MVPRGESPKPTLGIAVEVSGGRRQAKLADEPCTGGWALASDRTDRAPVDPSTETAVIPNVYQLTVS
jgi:hypothetical protein